MKNVANEEMSKTADPPVASIRSEISTDFHVKLPNFTVLNNI